MSDTSFFKSNGKVFPKRGGAYDTFSLPLFSAIKGKASYKNRLDLTARNLADQLILSSNPKHGEIKRGKGAFIEALSLLLHSFAHVASVPGKYKYVSLSMSRNDYYGQSSQFRGLPYTGLRLAIELMAEESSHPSGALLFKRTGHLDRKGKVGLRTRLEPSIGLLDYLVQSGLVFPGHPKGLSKAKSEGGIALLRLAKTSEGADNKIINSMDRSLSADERVLIRVNERLRNLKLDFNYPNYRAFIENWNFKEGRSQLQHMNGDQLYRQFTDEDGSAGRLYGHWVQNCPSTLRQYLTFNRLETVELDYRSMQLYLLYGLAGASVPEGDLYQIGKFDRHWAKAVLTKSVGAETQDIAVNALRKDMQENDAQMLAKAQILFDQFWERHAAVKPLLFQDQIWKQLQFLDSTIGLSVLERLMRHNITCIPIHDSFIVQTRHKNDLKIAMCEAFQSVFPKIIPEIK
jgi:hypothetical protein